MRPISLKTKVSLSLGAALFAAMSLFTLLIQAHWRADAQEIVARHVVQIANLIVASTHHAMLANKRQNVDEIVAEISQHKKIKRVRVLDAHGTIIHTNRPAEFGYSVEKSDPSCINCHKTATPLKEIPDTERWQIVESPGEPRVLVAMEAIRNQPSCSSASCHEHPASQVVLGIVEVAYSLDEVDWNSREHAIHVAGISLGLILLLTIGLGAMLKNLIYQPLKDIEFGANAISAGNLDQLVPMRSNDEFGRVAGHFNRMTKALQQSRGELEELVQTLESKVEERTQELQVAEAEVMQGQKLASVGVMAAGIAHELNNPLTGVLTFTTLLRRKMPDGSEDAEDLDLVIRETRRCAAIIKRLLDFAREKVPVNSWFDLNQVIDETVRFTDHTAALQKITVTTDLDPKLPRVWGDADLIKQVILNILVNAQQAIEAQGTIRVESRPHVARNRGKPGVKPAPMVEVLVRDTGCGIAADKLQRIFDPFYTSKEVGKGTGLGLSVSYGIVKAHGGRIYVESVVGEGSTFHVLLPIASPFGEGEDGESSEGKSLQ